MKYYSNDLETLNNLYDYIRINFKNEKEITEKNEGKIHTFIRNFYSPFPTKIPKELKDDVPLNEIMIFLKKNGNKWQ